MECFWQTLANVESNDVLDWIGLGTFPGANDALFNGFAYADFDGGKVETAPGILPEPTALGLFVLGVAGVALRRRIA